MDPAPAAPSWRPPFLLVLAIALAVAAALVSPWDEVWSDALTRLPLEEWTALDEASRWVEVFGKGVVLASLALFVGALGARRRALAAVLALVLCGAVVAPVKSIVDRPRPTSGGKSFPSGDAAGAAAAFLCLAQATPAGRVAGATAAAAVAANRVLRGRHYPSDVLAGLAVGALAALAAPALVTRLGERVGLPWPRLKRQYFLSGALALIAYGHLAILRKSSFGQGPPVFTFLVTLVPALLQLALLPFLRAAVRRRQGDWLEPSRASIPWARLVIMAGALTVGLLLVASASTLWDQDEPRYARATEELLQTGRLIYATFNFDLRAHKPMLTYYCMAPPTALYGHLAPELAARTPAALASGLNLVVVFLIGRRLVPQRVAWLGVVAMATTPLAIVVGSAATTDALLFLCMSWAVLVFLQGAQDGFTWRHGLWLSVALSLAQHVKGPVGLALPMGGVLGLWWLTRRTRSRQPGEVKVVLIASLVSVASFFAWAIPANAATGGRLQEEGLKEQLWDRIFNAMESHGGNFFAFLPYYPLVILAGFLPWTMYLPAALTRLWRRRLDFAEAAPGASEEQAKAGSELARGLLLGWLGFALVLLTLVLTKLPHYIFPVWPAVALPLAATVFAAQRGQLDELELRLLGWGRWLALAALGLGGLALVGGPWFVEVPGLRLPLVGGGLLLLAVGWTTSREQAAGRHFSAAGALTLGMLLIAGFAAGRVMPAAERYKVVAPFCRALNAKAPDLPTFFKFNGSTLIYYLDRSEPVTKLDFDQVHGWAKQPEPAVLITTQRELDKLERVGGPLEGLTVIHEQRGIDTNKGRWVTLLGLRRGLGRGAVRGGVPDSPSQPAPEEQSERTE